MKKKYSSPLFAELEFEDVLYSSGEEENDADLSDDFNDGFDSEDDFDSAFEGF